MKTSIPLSNKLRNLAVVCAALVVFIHTPCELSRGSALYQSVIRVFTAIQACAVPLFFAMSGAFAAVSLSRPDVNIRGFYWKKVKTLLIPFFVLNLIVCMIGYSEILCGIDYGFSHRLHDISLESFLRAFGFGKTRSPILGALWYVRCLFLLMLAAPIAYRVISRSRKNTIICVTGLAICCTGWILVQQQFNALDAIGYWMAPGSMLWFVLGMIWAHCGFRTPTRRCAWLLLVPIGIEILKKFTPPQNLRTIYALIEMFIEIPAPALALFSLMPARPWPTWLTRNSFGIYVLHGIVLNYLMLALNTPNCLYTLPVYFTIGCFTFFCSTLLSEFIHRQLPKLIPYLFGGR